MDALARATAAAAALGLALLAPSPPVVAQPLRPAASAAQLPPSDAGAEVVLRALSLLGVNYRFGGNTPDSGLDCSGLVRFVFHETLGMPLPRRSEDISRVGNVISTRELQPGDLVFFNTLRRAFSHVGIYIGNNQFVHAPATGKSIRVESLASDYWVRRFNGARRILDGEELAVPGLAQHDALIAAGLVPGPASALSAVPTAAPARPRAAVAAATRSGPHARAPSRYPAALLPPIDFGIRGNELTLN
jgi:hypothetical protein